VYILSSTESDETSRFRGGSVVKVVTIPMELASEDFKEKNFTRSKPQLISVEKMVSENW
jgi:hypothetical protein